MKSTLDAMEEAIMQKIHYWYDSQETDAPQEMGALRAGIREAIAQEDAQTVEPCGGCGETDANKRCVGCLHPFTHPTQIIKPSEKPWAFGWEIAGKQGVTLNDKGLVDLNAFMLFPLYRHESSPSTDHVADARKMVVSGERESLIKRLIARVEYLNHIGLAAIFPDNCALLQEASEMLAADAQDEWHAGRAAGIEECEKLSDELRNQAQQVAVPQGWKPDPIMEVFAYHPMGCLLVRPVGKDALTLTLGDKLYLAAPQPPQAERVPTCAHEKVRIDYDYVQCESCGAVKHEDASPGWYPSLNHAKRYARGES